MRKAIDFTKMNFFKRIVMKLDQPSLYVEQKQIAEYLSKYEELHRLLPIKRNPDQIPTFKHSGNSGDIIYSLPAVISLSENLPNHLYLALNQLGSYREEHPLGNLRLNEKMASMLMPLLRAQHYLKQVSIHQGERVVYDLDLIRQMPMRYDRGDIARWYFYIFNTTYDLSKKWLSASPDNTYSEYIALARSQRHNNPNLDYRFLNRYGKIVFLGVEKEYQLMKSNLPNLQYAPVSNFLEMAQIIAGVKLFIGNQSFPYAIAEAMKVKRILEMYFLSPNVVIHGEDGYEAYFQKNFEVLVEKLYE
jgi:hypothetical protein